MEAPRRLASVFAIAFFNEAYVEDVPDSNSKPQRIKYERVRSRSYILSRRQIVVPAITPVYSQSNILGTVNRFLIQYLTYTDFTERYYYEEFKDHHYSVYYFPFTNRI